MKIMEIPVQIQKIMKEYGMNTTKLVGDNQYLIYSKAKDGFIIPTGLPMVIDFHMGRTHILSNNETFKVLKKL